MKKKHLIRKRLLITLGVAIIALSFYQFGPLIKASLIKLIDALPSSWVKIAYADPAAPNPGHIWKEMECDTNLCVDTTNHEVGIGTTAPQSKLDVSAADSGVTYNTETVLGVESNTHAAISINTPNNKQGWLMFGDPENNNIGGILYDHPVNRMSFFVNDNYWAHIESDGRVGLRTMPISDTGVACKGMGDTSGTYALRVYSYTLNELFRVADDGGVFIPNGGVHVGGDSDPGDNNLLVDGKIYIGSDDYIDWDDANNYMEFYADGVKRGANLLGKGFYDTDLGWIDITGVNSGEGTKGGASSGTATIEFDCSEVASTGLACSGEDIYIQTTYRGADARCSGTYTYLNGDGACRDVRTDGDLYDDDTHLSEGQVETYVANDVSTGYVPRDNGNKFQNSPIYTTSSTGNVGIGTTSPLAKLHVHNDDIIVSRPLEERGIVFVHSQAGLDNNWWSGIKGYQTTGYDNIGLKFYSSDPFHPASIRMIITPDGGIFAPDMKKGNTQAAAGAAADELWVDTDDSWTIKMGL